MGTLKWRPVSKQVINDNIVKHRSIEVLIVDKHLKMYLYLHTTTLQCFTAYKCKIGGLKSSFIVLNDYPVIML